MVQCLGSPVYRLSNIYEIFIKMLKFYRRIRTQHSKSLTWVALLTRHNGFASATIAEPKNVNRQNISEDEKPTEAQSNTTGKLVKTVFASIHLKEHEEIQTPSTDNKLLNAKSVDELLSISDGSGVSRKHAFKVVSILSNWTTSNKVKLNEFERDPRFIRLCKILSRGFPGLKVSRPAETALTSDDLSTVLNVTADEEAAKLVGSISLPQMVKVLTTLSIKKRRSTLLLRTLAFNIAGSSRKMDIKQCADLFYGVSSLNFYDENLFEKAVNNIVELIHTENIKKSAVMGSILTSVGLLKYKNPTLLDAISEWIVKNHTHCRPQDVFSFFMTIGVLNYVPSNADNLFKTLVPQLTQEEAGKPSLWLDIVWSLILLNQANDKHIQSVLNNAFLSLLEERKLLNTSAILKLLNIDGAAHYLLDKYSGPKISKDHFIRKTTLLMSKEKSLMVNAVIESIKNLIPENYFRTRVNTGLGFYIDAECALDKTCNPMPLTEVANGERLKVAILVYDYPDICKGRNDLTGVNALSQRLLSAMGYRTVSIPYTEFKITDKIVNKVQYLESKLKEAIKQ